MGIGDGPNAVNLRETSGPSHLGVNPAEEIPEAPAGILIFPRDPVFLIRGFFSDRMPTSGLCRATRPLRRSERVSASAVVADAA